MHRQAMSYFNVRTESLTSFFLIQRPEQIQRALFGHAQRQIEPTQRLCLVPPNIGAAYRTVGSCLQFVAAGADSAFDYVRR
jgi:hypothetical protein